MRSKSGMGGDSDPLDTNFMWMQMFAHTPQEMQ